MLLNRLYDYIRLIPALLAPATSWKIGNGRNTTTDGNAVFKTNMKDNEDVDAVGTGFGSRKPTPEQRIVSVEREVEGWCCFDFFGDQWFEVIIGKTVICKGLGVLDSSICNDLVRCGYDLLLL